MSEMDVREKVETLVARGTELLREKHYPAAVESFEAALKLVPSHDAASRYLRFAKVGAKGARRAMGGSEPKTTESTIPAGDFKILRRAKRPRAKAQPRRRNLTETTDE